MQRIGSNVGASLIDSLLSEPGEPLDHDVKQRMEAGFSTDFSRVRVHRSPLSALANRVLRSRAFTIRDQIFFSANTYQPHCSSDLLLIAHELAHVVQKRLDITADSGGRSFTGALAAENEAHVAAEEITRGSRFRCSVPVDPEAISCWGEAGHFYTSHFVLLAAGLDYSLAKNLAFFAQMGDEVIELDAVEQGEGYLADLPGLTGPAHQAIMRQMQQRLEIQKGLHSLTGANAEVETAWRAHILEDASETPDDLAVGLAIHAFGDSFSHRKLEDEKQMYLAPEGHLVAALHRGKLKHQSGTWWERRVYAGHAPDKMEERPHLYQRYGEELFAISRFRWGAASNKGIALSELRSALAEISTATGEPDQIFKIRHLCAKLCQPIGPKYFPELSECVTYKVFLAKHGLSPSFLDRARHYARSWSTRSAKPAPARKAQVSDYEMQAKPSTQKQQKIHRVVSGESLSGISAKYYGKFEFWPTIWNEPQNRKLIGSNPNLIRPGWELVIPEGPNG